jgi:hypothetical protein
MFNLCKHTTSIQIIHILCLLATLQDAAHAKVSAGKPGLSARQPAAGESPAEVMLRTQKSPNFMRKPASSPQLGKKLRLERAKSLSYGQPGFTEK